MNTPKDSNTTQPKRKRGRPIGSIKLNKPVKISTGKRGRPPGAKNKKTSVNNIPQDSSTRGPGRPPGRKNKKPGRKGRPSGKLVINTHTVNNSSRAEQLYESKRGPGRPAGVRNKSGVDIRGQFLVVDLDATNIKSVYYISSKGKKLKCLPMV